ncbi:CYFA0S17e01420g1_1 [Cyberlindnera fabianii]|uniref:Mediator of RNA polymerase II transcription subunit 9 n=1 Tax=Cyberlindnera fabianii TaxID=36022 RepID=A0A061B7F1_CYBFA|nr:CYFA0S17e01420g1_1 [Cyberlindnera fabianii]
MGSVPRRGTPLATPMQPTPASAIQDKDRKWKDAETAIEELKSIELIPLVMDVVIAASNGTLRAQDVENAAREILRNIHGLSETPEERSVRVDKLKRNIEVKEKSLHKFRDLVGKRITLPPREDTQEATMSPDQQGHSQQRVQISTPTITEYPAVTKSDAEPADSNVDLSDIDMVDQDEFKAEVPESDAAIDISGIEDIPNLESLDDHDMNMG